MEKQLFETLKKTGEKIKSVDDVEKYIDNLTDDEYKTLLILHHIFELFELRKLPQPKFKQQQNLYKFETSQLQVIFHKKNDLTVDMLNPNIQNVVFIQSKKFKQKIQKDSDSSSESEENPIDNFNIQYISKDLFLYSFKDKQIQSVDIIDKLELYKNYPYENKGLIIYFDDPLVQIIGAKIGQFLKIDTLLFDNIIYHEISYKLVQEPQMLTVQGNDEEGEGEDVANMLNWDQ